MNDPISKANHIAGSALGGVQSCDIIQGDLSYELMTFQKDQPELTVLVLENIVILGDVPDLGWIFKLNWLNFIGFLGCLLEYSLHIHLPCLFLSLLLIILVLLVLVLAFFLFLFVLDL